MVTSRYYQVEIHLPLFLWLRNFTKHSRIKLSTHINFGSDETETQDPLTLRSSPDHVFNMVRFTSMKQRFLS